MLKGLLRCGRRGRRRLVPDAQPAGRYSPACGRAVAADAEPLGHSLAAPGRDDRVAKPLLAAVESVALEASLAAIEDVERQRAELQPHWQLRQERARYEGARAARPYRACEPERRLAARALERRWEETLHEQHQLDEAEARWQRSAPSRLSAEDRTRLCTLADDLPALWRAETTTVMARQRSARWLLEQVAVTADKTSERVAAQWHWAGGSAEHGPMLAGH